MEPCVERVGHFMKVRLTQRLAESIDRVDLVDRRVGDVFEVPDAAARLLLAEGWAVSVSAPQDVKRQVQQHSQTVGVVGDQEQIVSETTGERIQTSVSVNLETVVNGELLSIPPSTIGPHAQVGAVGENPLASIGEDAHRLAVRCVALERLLMDGSKVPSDSNDTRDLSTRGAVDRGSAPTAARAGQFGNPGTSALETTENLNDAQRAPSARP